MCVLSYSYTIVVLVFSVLLIRQSNSLDSCHNNRLTRQVGDSRSCDLYITDSPNRKVCPGIGRRELGNYEQIDINNIHMFKNCTIIDGSILITRSTILGDEFLGFGGLEEERLQVFSSVKCITGYLAILWLSRETDLSAFRNVEVILGQEVYEGFSFVVLDTNVTYLGLTSLHRIDNGDVYIKWNPSLCYVTKAMLRKLLVSAFSGGNIEGQFVDYGHNGQTCEKDGFVCDSECTNIGCWGPGPTQCMECKHFKIEDKCIFECDTNNKDISMHQTSTNECNYCHDECMGACFGPGPTNCTKCRNVKDGLKCTGVCPLLKYPDGNNTCQNCHPYCTQVGDNAGCTGPELFVGYEGCNSCDQVYLERLDDENPNNITATCMEKGTPCLKNSIEYIPHNGLYKDIKVCEACHPDCQNCNSDVHSCNTCLHHSNGSRSSCSNNCTNPDYFIELHTCKPCHHECKDGCTGESNQHCNDCKHYRDKENDKVTCVSECPKDRRNVTVNNTCVWTCKTNALVKCDSHTIPCRKACTNGCTDEKYSSCCEREQCGMNVLESDLPIHSCANTYRPAALEYHLLAKCLYFFLFQSFNYHLFQID
ncbi:epidermal growth factor receptor-like [Glandiceps talaboti]